MYRNYRKLGWAALGISLLGAVTAVLATVEGASLYGVGLDIKLFNHAGNPGIALGLTSRDSSLLVRLLGVPGFETTIFGPVGCRDYRGAKPSLIRDDRVWAQAVSCEIDFP